MNDPSAAGAIVGTLIAGILCGVAPFAYAWSRKRTDLAWASLLVCGFAGLIFGLLLAIPAALACCAVIRSLERGQDASTMDRWQESVSHAVDLTPRQPEAAVAAPEVVRQIPRPAAPPPAIHA